MYNGSSRMSLSCPVISLKHSHFGKCNCCQHGIEDRECNTIARPHRESLPSHGQGWCPATRSFYLYQATHVLFLLPFDAGTGKRRRRISTSASLASSNWQRMLFADWQRSVQMGTCRPHHIYYTW